MMNRYENYKNSKIDWIGKIPKDWNIVKTRYLCDITTGNRDTQDKNQNGDYPFFVRSQNIERINSYSYNGEAVLTSGDGAGVGKIFHHFIGKFEFHQRVYKFSEFKQVEGRYFYWFLSEHFRYEILRWNAKSTVDSVRLPLIQNFPIVIPPIEIQKNISQYLDIKTKKIDSLIQKIEKKIELINEQKTALINQCVTKGLNPNVEKKDSGVEWIGKIPIHWQLLRLNNLGRFSKGKGITKDKIKVNGNKCIRCGEIYTTYELRFNRTRSFIDDDTSDESVLATKGVLLFAGDGESLEEIGKCIVYEGEEELYIGGGINVFTPKQEKVIPIYLSYVMNSESVIYQKSRQGKGEIVVHIYSKELKEIRLGLPSIKEQQQIVEYLDQKTSLIDKIIYYENKRLLIFKEYKKSLISEVVTGKKRVV